MKDKFNIEITLRQQLPASLYKDCISIEAFRNWLYVITLVSISRKKLKSETVLLITTAEVAALCLN